MPSRLASRGPRQGDVSNACFSLALPRRALVGDARRSLSLAGCGSDRDDADEAAPTHDRGTDGSDTTTAPAVEMFGDLESPCGEGDAIGAHRPRASRTTRSPSATATTPASRQRRASNHELSDAIKAMIEWCNDQGGINGREVKGNYYDAKILDVNNVMIAACSDGVFMLVGEGWSLDSGAGRDPRRLRPRRSARLRSEPGVRARSVHGRSRCRTPPTTRRCSTLAAFAKAFPDKIKKTAVIVRQLPGDDRHDATRCCRRTRRSASSSSTATRSYNIAGEDDWKPFVQNLKDCGAEVVCFIGLAEPELPELPRGRDAARLQADLHDSRRTSTTQQFAEWNAENGDAADDVYIRQTYLAARGSGRQPGRPGSTSTSSTETAATSASSASRRPAPSCCGPRASKACGSNVTPRLRVRGDRQDRRVDRRRAARHRPTRREHAAGVRHASLKMQRWHVRALRPEGAWHVRLRPELHPAGHRRGRRPREARPRPRRRRSSPGKRRAHRLRARDGGRHHRDRGCARTPRVRAGDGPDARDAQRSGRGRRRPRRMNMVMSESRSMRTSGDDRRPCALPSSVVHRLTTGAAPAPHAPRDRESAGPPR